MGRTGEWFAYQHYSIQPDIVTLAKPIANGLPMGAMLCTDEAARAFSPGMHGTTFGGGPLACAVAIAVIDTMKRDNVLEHIRDVGGYFKQQLEELKKKHDCIVDVRGMGLMLGVEIDSDDLAKRAAAEMMAKHIIINRTSDTVLRFLPPYILERAHVDTAVAALDQVLTGLTSNNAALAGQSPAGEHVHG
jgi:acetylornithine aminotransferase/acetylornithine/N-succinyldiaminopimelate aminotransferase